MNLKCLFIYLLTALLIIFVASCKKDPIDNTNNCGKNLNINFDTITYSPHPYTIQLPPTLPDTIPILPENPLTIEGIKLGRKLFYDPILSKDTTQSCASCHNQANAFTDNNKAFSKGIDGLNGNRNSMALFNLAWGNNFFWDGRAKTLEEQAQQPVPNPIEMHLEWIDAECRLNNDKLYRIDFYKAFGTKTITQQLVGNAIAQFERTLISGTSPYDLAATPGSGVELSDEALLGYELFFTEGGDCFHCHGNPKLFTDFAYHNNGLDYTDNFNGFLDLGLGKQTQVQTDNGKLKTPSLRNLAFTAPYMHDGRFATLNQVLDHYSEGIKNSPTIDPVIKATFPNGLHLTEPEKSAILAFLATLNDTAFINNPNFSKP